MPGLNKFGDKQKREARRRNAVARALSSPQYKQQIIPNKKRWVNEDYDDDDERA